MKLDDYKTVCCAASFYRKGRANYRCSECDKDVTLELTFLQQALEE